MATTSICSLSSRRGIRTPRSLVARCSSECSGMGPGLPVARKALEMGEVDGSLPIPKAADAIEERGVLRPQHREDAAVGVVDRKHEPERISATVAAEGIGDAAHAGKALLRRIRQEAACAWMRRSCRVHDSSSGRRRRVWPGGSACTRVAVRLRRIIDTGLLAAMSIDEKPTRRLETRRHQRDGVGPSSDH